VMWVLDWSLRKSIALPRLFSLRPPLLGIAVSPSPQMRSPGKACKNQPGLVLSFPYVFVRTRSW
jgi:hypothetical protein